jgi:hypothetical protein
MTRLGRPIFVVVAAPVVAVSFATAAIIATGTNRRLGATREEATQALPGDELLDHADIQADRAITIAAAPDRVWPWIAHLGQDKGGFYSFAWVENLVGCDIHNADRIMPAWQTPQVGDAFPLHPEMTLTVDRVDPGRVLVATSRGGSAQRDIGMDFTWAFVVSALPGGSNASPATRLQVRERYRASGFGVRAGVELLNLISTVMSWQMLRNLKELAERPEVPNRKAPRGF